MKHFALIGYPLGHTMSPPIHQRLFALSGTEADYRVMEIAPEDLESSWTRLRQLDGFNVTIPYKQKIIPFCGALDDTACRYGAVNTVDCKTGTGFNTDCVGFLRSLGDAPLEGEVLVAGAGGVGRMFAIESARQGARVTLAVRPSSLKAAKTLKTQIEADIPGAVVRVALLEKVAAENSRYRWLINATPVGMYPKTDAMVVPPSVLERCDNLFDAIYNPAETMLMASARKAGCRVIGGMAMLVWQAAQAHVHWYGADFCQKDIEALVREMEAKMEASR